MTALNRLGTSVSSPPHHALVFPTPPSPHPSDLRTRRTYPIVLHRARYLPIADQNLLRLVLEGNHSFRQLGPLFGRSPGETCRRVQRLLRRLRDPIVAALIDFPADLPQDYREIGLAHLLQRRSLRDIAQQLNQPITEIRATIAYIRGWARMAQRVWTTTTTQQRARRERAETEVI